MEPTNDGDSLTPVVVKAADQRAALHTAHQAMMLDDAAQTLKTHREATRATLLGATGLSDEGDGMGIHIGDSVQHVHAPPPAPASTAGASGLLKAGLLAAALLGTGGIGAAVTAWLLRPSIAAPVAGPAAAPSVDPKPQQFRVRWRVQDGKMLLEPPEPIE